MARPGSWSLRNRVYLVGAVAIVVAWVGGGLTIYSSGQREYERMCHENLANLAETVLSFSQHELHEVAADGQTMDTAPVHTETIATLGKRYSYQIWSGDGRLLLRSVRAPDRRPLGVLGAAGLSELQIDGKKQDVYVLLSRHEGLEIHVADSSDEQMAFSLEFLKDLRAAFFLSMLPVLLGTWLLMRGAFDSLLSAAHQLQHRRPNDMKLIDVPKLPHEVRPLVTAINGLLAVVEHELHCERSFTALAAHELRTPLASIRVQAQVLARAEGKVEREQGVAALSASADRCARLITQLLELARADTQSVARGDRAVVKLDETCADVLSDFVDEATRRQIQLTCSLTANEVVADRTSLQTLLRNLVSNAMKHTPDAGAISICTTHESGSVVLCVDDSGSGIPEEERESVFRRFYRGIGATGIGVGLGLAIVSSIVRAHRAAVTLGQAPMGGLRVEVRFPIRP